MATESEIRAEMSAIERWYREESAENERLKQQIDDLEIALAYVKSAKREAREIEDTFKTYNPDDAWKGRSRERFGSQRYQVYAKAHRYREAIDELEDRISSKIWDLRLQVNVIAEAITGFDNRLNELSRALGELMG
ncbi:DUF5082 family protein [Enorma phocaeensis]|uniref:DUF5082 family protein n=1 Tax=Enorma phocaeensis TaxID=1871019 RepID=UPI000C8233A0|nr:DUF5082 family protein [Enorma phocaeensis]